MHTTGRPVVIDSIVLVNKKFFWLFVSIFEAELFMITVACYATDGYSQQPRVSEWTTFYWVLQEKIVFQQHNVYLFDVLIDSLVTLGTHYNTPADWWEETKANTISTEWSSPHPTAITISIPQTWRHCLVVAFGTTYTTSLAQRVLMLSRSGVRCPVEDGTWRQREWWSSCSLNNEHRMPW